MRRQAAHLEQYAGSSDGLSELYRIQQQLLALHPEDIRECLKIAKNVKGLGVAGASGLLALMYPADFGTVDQFVVKALRELEGLPEREAVTRMKPDELSIPNAVLLMEIMRRKAEALNQLFHATTWTPRKIDKVLWTYGRKRNGQRPEAGGEVCSLACAEEHKSNQNK